MFCLGDVFQSPALLRIVAYLPNRTFVRFENIIFPGRLEVCVIKNTQTSMATVASRSQILLEIPRKKQNLKANYIDYV